METRYNKDCLKIEERRNGDRRIVGRAIVFNRLSSDLGGWRERILPSAVARTVAEDDIVALWNHDDSRVLGRKSAGTLELDITPAGLDVMIDAPNNSWGADVLESIRRGDVVGMSFRFSVLPEGVTWLETDSEGLVREVSNLRLFEVSPVTFPAYPDTTVAVRSLLDRGIVPLSGRLNKLSRRLELVEVLLGVS